MRAVELRVLDEQYAVWKLSADAEVPGNLHGRFVSVTRTANELSVVAPSHLAPEDVPIETGWSCFEVQGPLAFELTGILAAVSAPLAAAEIPIFAVSTFDTDYLLVRTVHLERAVTALRTAGHRVSG